MFSLNTRGPQKVHGKTRDTKNLCTNFTFFHTQRDLVIPFSLSLPPANSQRFETSFPACPHGSGLSTKTRLHPLWAPGPVGEVICGHGWHRVSGRQVIEEGAPLQRRPRSSSLERVTQEGNCKAGSEKGGLGRSLEQALPLETPKGRQSRLAYKNTQIWHCAFSTIFKHVFSCVLGSSSVVSLNQVFFPLPRS